ncbi:hypothetical protein GIB67_034525 [Kingdonia uniflora]|uniref:Pentatricopeptide repeat-containing protein n=1 Tax=Kingdonia uniflora TaxID=39325 RepID=A0A7J7PBD0_9MAGN|nr:hypothetical protein GIB67_034525 [Kingdonia uniflora]
MLDRGIGLCNAMLGGYLRNERYVETLDLYRRVMSSGVRIDSFTCTFVLKACTGLSDVESGRGIVRDAVENGLSDDRFFGSWAISFLMKFGNVDEARIVFERLSCRDVVCWNSMIGGYVSVGSFDMAFDMFSKMRGSGIRLITVTVVSLIQA